MEMKNKKIQKHIQEHGTLINSDFLNGLTVEEAKKLIIDKIEKIGIGKKRILFRLKDWGVSRQRYWGCPIPMIYLKDGSCVPVDKKNYLLNYQMILILSLLVIRSILILHGKKLNIKNLVSQL